MPSLTQQPFPLLKLPSEIRNHIWRCIVIKDEGITFHEYMVYSKSRDTGLRVGNPVSIRQDGDEPRQTSLLAIAFTCRQFYLEVTPIYYGENVFRPLHWNYVLTFNFSGVLKSFAAAIGPTNASTITQLQLYEPFMLPDDELPNLKRLYFDEPGITRASDKMTWSAVQHKSLRIIYRGEEWEPDKWRLHPPEELQ